MFVGIDKCFACDTISPVMLMTPYVILRGFLILTSKKINSTRISTQSKKTQLSFPVFTSTLIADNIALTEVSVLAVILGPLKHVNFLCML